MEKDNLAKTSWKSHGILNFYKCLSHFGNNGLITYCRSDHCGGATGEGCTVYFYIPLRSRGLLTKWSWKIMEKSWNFICGYPREP